MKSEAQEGDGVTVSECTVKTTRTVLSRAGRFAVALVCACGLLQDGASIIAATKAATHTVVMDGVKFEPETVTLTRGDTVACVNKDPFPHTVTSKGAFDSRSIAPGKSWKYTPTRVGEYPYICTLHPNMKGMLKVEWPRDGRSR